MAAEIAPDPLPGTRAMKKDLPPSWRKALAEEFTKPYFHKLEAFVDQERRTHTVYPPEDDVFNAFKLTPLEGPCKAGAALVRFADGVRAAPGLAACANSPAWARTAGD